MPFGPDQERQYQQQTGQYRPQPLASQALPGAGYGTTVPTRSAASTATAPTTPSASASAFDPYESFRKQNQSGSAEDIIRKAYQSFMGREADPEGLAAHLKNPNGLSGVIRTIYDSPETQAYRTANPNAAAWIDPAKAAAITAGGAGSGLVAPPAPAAATPSVFQGFTPKYAMEGFDFAREQNTGKSAKDAFAYLSNQAPPPPINDKAALGLWFTKYIQPGMDALGHKVGRVDGDKFTFSNWQGNFEVDFGRGAGADGGALAWQVQDGYQLGNGPYVPLPGAAVTKPPAGPAPTGDEPVVVAPDPENSNTMPISSAVAYRRPYRSGSY